MWLFQLYLSAIEAVDGLFFVGLQEAYEVSVQALLREMGVQEMNVSLAKERDQSNPTLSAQKKLLKDNKVLMNRAKEVNSFDIRLYAYGE